MYSVYAFDNVDNYGRPLNRIDNYVQMAGYAERNKCLLHIMYCLPGWLAI